MRQKAAVALVGEPPPQWASLQRTYRAYREGLAKVGYRVVPLAENDAVDPDIAAVINFWGSAAWRPHIPSGIPRIMCLHGGAMINYRELATLVGALGPMDAVIANCSSDIAILEQLRPCSPRLELLPLPVDPSLQPRPSSQARKQFHLPAEALILGFVGRLVPHKGLHHFLRTVAYCRERHGQGVYGIVVGDFWPDYSLLDELSHDYRAYIAGLIAAHELDGSVFFPSLEAGDIGLGAIYSAIDLLVHPTTSPDENFGYVPLEAWKCGTAVVATAYGGLKDCLPNVSTAAAVPTWATESGTRFDLYRLMSVTSDALACPGWRASVGARGAALVDREYSSAAFENRLHGIVEDAIVRSRKGGEPSARVVDRSMLRVSRQPLEWSDIAPAVETYTSVHSAGPPVNARTYRWPGRYRPEKGTYEFDDPAWPMSVQLDPVLASLITRSPPSNWGCPPLMSDRHTRTEPDPRIESLVRRGVLAWTDRL